MKFIRLFVVSILGLGLSALAQDGRVAYRQLTWDDFRVDDSVRSPHKALTQWGVNTSYRFRTSKQGDGYVSTLTSFTISSFFDPGKSWRRSALPNDTDALLKHEQGHFDLAEIVVRMTRSIPAPSGWGRTVNTSKADIQAQVRAFRDERIAEVRRLQQKYDVTTNHSRNKDVQAKWNAYIEAKLKDPYASVSEP